MSDPNLDDLRLAYQLETQEVDEDGNVVVGFDQAGEMFNRAIEAHDAATREAVLVEVAEWLESFGHYDNIAEQVRYLYPHTPQGRAGEGHRA